MSWALRAAALALLVALVAINVDAVSAIARALAGGPTEPTVDATGAIASAAAGAQAHLGDVAQAAKEAAGSGAARFGPPPGETMGDRVAQLQDFARGLRRRAGEATAAVGGVLGVAPAADPAAIRVPIDTGMARRDPAAPRVADDDDAATPPPAAAGTAGSAR